jgi:hypothetical protein
MRVKPLFVLESRERVWTLPVSALGNGDELWWVDTGGMTAHRIPVQEIGTFGDLIEVPAGYGQRFFVIDGQHRLSEGQSITVLGDT